MQKSIMLGRGSEAHPWARAGPRTRLGGAAQGRPGVRAAPPSRLQMWSKFAESTIVLVLYSNFCEKNSSTLTIQKVYYIYQKYGFDKSNIMN